MADGERLELSELSQRINSAPRYHLRITHQYLCVPVGRWTLSCHTTVVLDVTKIAAAHA